MGEKDIGKKLKLMAQITFSVMIAMAFIGTYEVSSFELGITIPDMNVFMTTFFILGIITLLCISITFEFQGKNWRFVYIPYILFMLFGITNLMRSWAQLKKTFVELFSLQGGLLPEILCIFCITLIFVIAFLCKEIRRKNIILKNN